jgi:hypothetical protein
VTPAGPSRRERLERRILLSPGLVSRAAGTRAPGPEERWMLGQSRELRENYVAEVVDRPGDEEVLRQIWMMRQPEEIRESFIREVLEPELEQG